MLWSLGLVHAHFVAVTLTVHTYPAQTQAVTANFENGSRVKTFENARNPDIHVWTHWNRNVIKKMTLIDEIWHLLTLNCRIPFTNIYTHTKIELSQHWSHLLHHRVVKCLQSSKLFTSVQKMLRTMFVQRFNCFILHRIFVAYHEKEKQLHVLKISYNATWPYIIKSIINFSLIGLVFWMLLNYGEKLSNIHFLLINQNRMDNREHSATELGYSQARI